MYLYYLISNVPARTFYFFSSKVDKFFHGNPHGISTRHSPYQPGCHPYESITTWGVLQSTNKSMIPRLKLPLWNPVAPAPLAGGKRAAWPGDHRSAHCSLPTSFSFPSKVSARIQRLECRRVATHHESSVLIIIRPYENAPPSAEAQASLLLMRGDSWAMNAVIRDSAVTAYRFSQPEVLRIGMIGER